MQLHCSIKLFPIAVMACLCLIEIHGYSQSSTAAGEAKTGSSRGTLPESALRQAQEAEKHLVANRPDEAIKILKDIDKQFPGQAAISLRLAEIYDTNNRYGAALFYYRRYIRLAGNRAREIAVGRVSTLEVMVGIDDEAEKIAKEMSESTRPVATPVSKVEREILVQATDGSRVPIRSAEDVERIDKQGFVRPLPKSAQTPQITPVHTPIVIPESLGRPTPPVSIQGNQQSLSISRTGGSPREQSRVSSVPTTTPKPDADALLASAFVKAQDPEATPEPASSPSPVQITPEPVVTSEIETIPPPLKLEPQNSISTPARTPRPPVSVRATIVTRGSTPAVAYTQPHANSESPRAENFFNVSVVGGAQARVAIINNLDAGVVVVSLTPLDDGEVLSTILMPGESKTLFVKPKKYNVSANASTTDYSPITLMNTQFDYKFEAGRQYTRRFTQSNLQQLN